MIFLKGRNRKLRLFLWLFSFISLTIPAMLVLARTKLVVVTVKGPSMLPYLMEGDRVLVLRHWSSSWFRKGQVVVICLEKHPNLEQITFFTELILIKRIVALPEDKLVTTLEHSVEEGKRTWYIPPRHFFLCGDNELNSYDSRQLGPIPFNSLLGIVIMKLPYKCQPEERIIP